MLSSDELGLLTDEERQRYAASNLTEKMYMANELQNKARLRAIEKGIELNGQSVEQLQELVKRVVIYPASTSATSVNANSTRQSDDGFQGSFGVVLVGIGLLLICFAIWVFDTAPDGMHNLGLLNQQSGMTILGGALAICGSVFFAAERIVRGRS